MTPIVIWQFCEVIQNLKYQKFLQCFDISHFIEIPDLDGPIVSATIQRVGLLPESQTGNGVSVTPKGVDALEAIAGSGTDLPDVNEPTVVSRCLQ
jgi:hypothetical protein